MPGYLVLSGVDLLSLDGRLAVRCSNATLPYQEVKRFIRVARWVYKATPSEWHCNSLVAHAELIRLCLPSGVSVCRSCFHRNSYN